MFTGSLQRRTYLTGLAPAWRPAGSGSNRMSLFTSALQDSRRFSGLDPNAMQFLDTFSWRIRPASLQTLTGKLFHPQDLASRAVPAGSQCAIRPCQPIGLHLQSEELTGASKRSSSGWHLQVARAIQTASGSYGWCGECCDTTVGQHGLLGTLSEALLTGSQGEAAWPPLQIGRACWWHPDHFRR